MCALSITIRCALCVALFACTASAQRTGRSFDEERALESSAYLPIADGATELLATGDRAWAQALANEARDSAARAWSEAFGAWRQALVDTPTGALVAPRTHARAGEPDPPWPDGDGTASATPARRADGVEYAVLRRLSALAPAARASWNRQFAPLADVALAAAFDETSLARVERDFPATDAALRAALRLCDVELERARPSAARGWLERAERHAQLGAAASDAVATALRARRAALAPRQSETQAWAVAQNLAPTHAVMIDASQIAAANATRALLAPGVGIRPGLAFLSAQRVAVHVPGADGGERVSIVELATGRRTSTFEPRKLEPLPSLDWGGLTQYRPSQAPGWALHAASEGDVLVLTVGRHGWQEGNTLVCVEVEPGESIELVPLPRLRWALHDGRVATREIVSRTWDGWPDARIEFQPGGVIVDGVLYVLAREFAPGDGSAPSIGLAPDSQSEIKTWACAIDLVTAALLWRSDLGKGVEVQRNAQRMQDSSLGTSAAQPLCVAGERLFAGTHTGSGALLDLADGRIAWALLNQRRASGVPGWSGARPTTGDDASTLLWAPADSERLYWLRTEPDLDGRGVFALPPRAIEGARVLLGGDVEHVWLAGTRGSASQVIAWEPATGRRSHGPALAADEFFSGDGLVSPARALVATNRGLYLFDRERDARLVDFTALKLESAALATLGLPGGSVWASGEHVCVLGLSTLWIFETK